jgi:hypothetical protein
MARSWSARERLIAKAKREANRPREVRIAKGTDAGMFSDG